MTDPRFVEIHILQPVPFANLNRDDMGAPKDLSFGGTRRIRVSSQCYKRATREEMDSHTPGLDLGRRSRQHGGRLVQHLVGERGWPQATARIAALDIFGSLGENEDKETPDTDQADKPGDSAKGTTDPLQASVLMYFNISDLDRFADLAETERERYQRLADDQPPAADPDGTGSRGAPIPTVKRKTTKEKNAWKKALTTTVKKHTGAGLALFGRMIATLPEGRIDGAAQVAHAFTTHTAKLEIDYFTAVDDFSTGHDNSGSGHLDTAEYATGVFYRYATLDLRELADNLTDPQDTARLAREFVRAFTLAVPTGKRTSTAPYTLPALVYTTIRSERPVNLASAFEKPVERRDGGRSGGYVPESLRALGEHARLLDGFLGTDGRLWHAHAATVTHDQVNAGFPESTDGFGRRLDLPALLSELGQQLGAAE